LFALGTHTPPKQTKKNSFGQFACQAESHLPSTPKKQTGPVTSNKMFGKKKFEIRNSGDAVTFEIGGLSCFEEDSPVVGKKQLSAGQTDDASLVEPSMYTKTDRTKTSGTK
jgi:hypothetical protein